MLRVAGGGRCGSSNTRLSIALIALSATVMLSLERLQTHGVEGVQLLAIELFAKSGAPIAKPNLHSRFRQLRSAKKKYSRLLIKI